MSGPDFQNDGLMRMKSAAGAARNRRIVQVNQTLVSQKSVPRTGDYVGLKSEKKKYKLTKTELPTTISTTERKGSYVSQ